MSFEFEAVGNLLKCPRCEAALVPTENALVCVNPEHRLSFPILDGIPQLLAEEARELSPKEWTAIVRTPNDVEK